jgi:hypothetical protein
MSYSTNSDDIKQELEPYEHARLVATITYPLSTHFSGHTLSGFG